MTPPVAVTHRDLMPVTPTRPTFCENDVYGKGVEDAAENGADAVGAKSARDRRLIDLLAGHFAERQKHSDRFDHHHHHHDAHGDDRDQMKFRHAEPERDHHVDPGGGHHALEMHDAEERRQHRAGNDAEQHRDVRNEAGEPAEQSENHRQHEQRDAEPLKLPVAGIGEGPRHAVDHLGQGRQAAAGPVDADPHQRDADDQDDRAGDHGREKRQQPAHERRDDDGENAGRNHRTVDAEESDIGRCRHRQHRADRGEGDAHHHRQADADAGKPDALHQCRQSAGEQIGADQKGHVLGRQLQGAAKNKRHGDRACIHDQHMLKPKRQQLGNRQELDRPDERPAPFG